MVIIAVLVIAFVTSYKYAAQDKMMHSIKIEEYTAVLENKVSLDSIAGIYCSVLPPNVETTLTLNADGTYLLVRTFKEKQIEQKIRGISQVLDGNILILVHPSSDDNILYKVRGDKSVFLQDSFGNEPKK